MARESVVTRAARLVIGGCYGSAGNCRVEVAQNRATFAPLNYEVAELCITIVPQDAEADGDDASESANCPAAEWQAALAAAMVK